MVRRAVGPVVRNAGGRPGARATLPAMQVKKLLLLALAGAFTAFARSVPNFARG